MGTFGAKCPFYLLSIQSKALSSICAIMSTFLVIPLTVSIGKIYHTLNKIHHHILPFYPPMAWHG